MKYNILRSTNKYDLQNSHCFLPLLILFMFMPYTPHLNPTHPLRPKLYFSSEPLISFYLLTLELNKRAISISVLKEETKIQRLRFGQVYKADQGHYYDFINPLKHQWLDLTIGKQTNNLVAPRKSTPPIILVKKIIFIISNKFWYKFFEIFQNFKFFKIYYIKIIQKLFFIL